MDTRNCSSSLYATDRLFELNPIGTCDVSLVAIWVMFILIVLLRTAATVKKWLNHCRRLRLGVRSSVIGPVLYTCLALCYVVFFILILTDVTSVDNGFSFSVFTAGYLAFSAIYCVSLLRMVRLGVGAAVPGSSNDLGVQAKILQRFDFGGYFLLVLATVGIIVTSIVQIVISPIFPEKNLAVGAIGWASKGIFMACMTFGLVWQLQRCVILVQVKLPESPRKHQILWKVRRQQIHYLGFGVPFTIYFILLAVHVLPWTWYVFKRFLKATSR
jgi:hypothetical protein